MNSKLKVTVVAVLILMSFTTTIFAAEDEKVEVTDSLYVTISNAKFTGFSALGYVFSANAPVTVKFEGGMYLEQGIFELGGDKVKFDVQKYVIFEKNGQPIILDTLPENYTGEYYYASGNYATLNKPASYLAFATSPEIIDVPIVIDVSILAKPTESKVLVDGKSIPFEAYNINGSNYFKLRDIAMALNGTDKKFEVIWDNDNNAIDLISDKSYTAIGAELAVSDNPVEKKAIPTSSKIYLNGQEKSLIVYQIGENNYFKLRDIGKEINFGITWDSASNSIIIDTKSSYTE